MADDDAKGSGRSRFKSKWGKILKQSDDLKSLGDSWSNKKGKNANSQEEVDDFLKPSIERAATNRPRLDVSIAQRWPDTNDVRQAAGGFPLDTTQNVNGWRKKRRREGLTVGFVKTVPETIGHGGDETLDPPSDIAMQKARNVSAAVDSRPAGSGDRSSLPMPNALNEPRRQPPSKVDNQFDDRMLPNQRPIHPHWNEEPPPPKVGISRAPTGYSTLDESGTPEDERLRGPTLPDTSQQLDSRLAPQTEEQDSDRLKVSPTPRNPHTLVARKQNDMRANEGMALRRASAMIEPLDIEDDGDLDLGLYAAATATHRAEAAATPPTHVSDRPPVIPSIDAIPPPSDAEPDSPSPFADSRYLKRHSREEPLAQQRKQEEEIMSPGPPQGARSPFADPKYLKSRSRDPSPSKPLRQGDVDPVATVHLADEASQQYQDLLPQSNPLASPPPGGDHRTMPLQHNNFENSAHQPREGPATRLEPTVPDLRPRPEERTDTTKERSLQRGTARSVSHENAPPSYGRPMPAPRLNTEPQDQSHGRDPTFDPQAIMQRPMAGTRSPNGPRPIVQGNHPSSGGHSRNNSYNKASPQSIPSRSEDTGSELSPQASLSQATSGPSLPEIAASMKSANYLGPRPYEPRHHGSSSQLAPPEASPYARRPSTNDYFELERQHPQQPAKSPLNHSLRPDDHSRPGSAHSNRSFLRSQPPPQDAPSETSAADAAFEDFASRVAHMKGVFRLTAEKEQPAEKCSPYMWLRTAYWWYLRGKVGLETLLRQRAKYREAEHRELLTQPHVDLAKTSWILSDPLEDLHHSVQQGHSHTPDSHALLLRDVRILKDCLKSLSQSMLKANIMPPPQSLIQGQDTQIWLDYPKFTPDLEAVLGGVGDQNPSLVNKYTQPLSASDALPLGDTESHHCYSRFLVNVFMNTEDVSTDRISVPCTLTVLRGKQEYQSTIVISSQSQLVNLKVAPRQSEPKALNWQDVSWKASSLSITINLPQGVHANIRLFEQNFRTLWNLVEYSRRVDHSLRHEDDEVLVHDMPLVEVQYADTSNPNAFPQDKVKHCRMLVWERLENFQNMGAMRKRHRGFHVLVVTEPTHKTLSYFSHRICANGPLFFEFITDAAAHGTTAMVIRVREESKECRMLLVFPDAESRQSLYNKLNGIDVRSDETIIGKMSLADLSVEALNENANAAMSGKGDFSYLQWQRLGVTNHFIENTNSRLPSTVESESLRIIARHGHGCITDRLNLDKGELLLRLPCTNSPTVQLLRQPQVDLTMSIDARNAPPRTPDSVADVFKVIQNHHTVRTFTFTTPHDLYAFETAITGLTVLYDGLASTLGISRRMMVVPIYHKWTASNVRIQILANAQSTVFQLIAFMEDFAHADALCFQIKSTDVFETIKGDAKGKKWAVKMVDAKFSLPPALSGKEGDERPAEERAKGRFVNLEGLDYAQEHDDIAVGFESQEARDEFAKALPAATKKSHMITLKRRI